MAKLNTRKLLGVLSSLTLRKATIVTAFRVKPSSPSVEQQTEMLHAVAKRNAIQPGARGCAYGSCHVKTKEMLPIKPRLHSLVFTRGGLNCDFKENNIGTPS